MSQEQWLFRQSSPIDKDGRVTRIIISHIPTVAATQKNVTPLILQCFSPPTSSVPHVDTSSRSEGETSVPRVEDISGEASQPSAGHPPLIMVRLGILDGHELGVRDRDLRQVSPQKLNKFCDTPGVFHWYRLEGNDPLSFLPSHVENVAEGDLFFYWVKSVGKCQMWIWRSVGGASTWVPA
ncbi:hypothetical protein EV401DRAFT_1883329 [Pisolithus croceorrhizus]|nr:hypothetical protein EV401DRAFT_1883329 [Pisolithus croceorrhizus]